ncbi:MAG: transporter substrate-binding domain-containing protein [Betaproteobacteria bacterium]|nr:transporter substrate-binding domain-containing protein [Betaproteobacteria bacterium]
MTITSVLSSLAGVPSVAGRESLRVSGDQSYPPLAYLEQGVPKGFDVDVVKALAAAMQRDIQIELSPWDHAQDRVRQGHSDCLIGMSITDDRRKLWDFATPTLAHSFSLFVTSGEVAIRGADDLHGRRVGVTAGGLPRTFFESKPQVGIVLISDYAEGFALLRKGSVDAVAADTWVAGYLLNKHRIDGVTVAGPPFATLDSAIAVPRGQQALLRDINAGLATLQKSGTLDDIRVRWEPKQVVYLLKEQVATYTILVVSVAGALLLAVMLGWILTMKREIRTRKGVENELRTSEEKFRTAFMAIPDAVIVNSYPGETITEVNQGFERMFGYPRNEAIGSTALKLGLFFDPADRDKVIAQFEARGGVTDYELRGRRKNGEMFFNVLSSNITPLGGTNFAVHVIRDETGRKRTEDALHMRQAKIESIFRGAPVGMGEVVDRVFTVVNDRMCEILGYSSEELVGRSTRMLYLSDSDWEDTGRVLHPRALAGGHGSVETRFRRKDGRIIDVLIGLSPIVAGDLSAGATVTVTDITERKAVARELEDAFARLKRLSGQLLNAQEMERRAIANELHDEIGQALTAVTLKLHALGKRISDGTASAGDVESCMGIADTALKQVRDLSLNLRPPQLDLMGLEAALRWLLATRTDGAALEAHFAARLPPHGRSPHVDITCFRLVQEALTNVIRHARAANLWVEATQANGEIELRIKDDGCGFDSDTAKASAAQGASVGLLSMEERVVLSGGSFELVSLPGAGTTIRARIPLVGGNGDGRLGSGGVR